MSSDLLIRKTVPYHVIIMPLKTIKVKFYSSIASVYTLGILLTEEVLIVQQSLYQYVAIEFDYCNYMFNENMTYFPVKVLKR
jgi:hypothetical protein